MNKKNAVTISYINDDNDMLVKYSYQQINNKKVAIRLENQRNIYFFGAVFMFVMAVYFLIKYKLGKMPEGLSSCYTTFILGALLIVFGLILKPYKEWEISRNVKKGIAAGENHVFKPVKLEINENKLTWDDGYNSGHVYVTPENKNVVFIEDEDYVFVSGTNNLDLVIPKDRITESQLEAIYKCYSYAQYKDK